MGRIAKLRLHGRDRQKAAGLSGPELAALLDREEKTAPEKLHEQENDSSRKELKKTPAAAGQRGLSADDIASREARLASWRCRQSSGSVRRS